MLKHFQNYFLKKLAREGCAKKSYEERYKELGLGDPRDKKKHVGHDPGAHAEICSQGQGGTRAKGRDGQT